MPEDKKPLTPPKEVDLVAERKKADENIKHKQEALTKANDACAKAHDDLMQAQKDAAHLPPVPPETN